MKRNFILIISILVALLSLKEVKAQTSMAVPNGSFENWSSGQGYSVQALFISLPVYSSFTYPTSWNYIAYPVNQTISYYGFSLNINTNVPLLKVSQQTGAVPDGSKALKMETFMLNDIINSTVYALAQSAIDTTYTNLVAPTVLTTGAVNINNFASLLGTITGNMGSQAQLLGALHDENINDYITGGIALNGFAPSRLTGSYKYASHANRGDNGGVLIIGTRYNPVTHMREAVGGGYNIALTDTNAFTAFEVQYQTLHEIDTQYADVAADSLIVMLISSANNHRQQGSALWLDQLQLLHDSIIVPDPPVTPDTIVPDTCNAILQLTVTSVDSCNATLTWNNEEVPANWQYSYGLTGYNVEDSTLTTITDSTLSLHNLMPGTTYDCYVRSQCNDTLFSAWAVTTFTTDTIVPPTPPIDTVVPPVDTTGIFNFNALGINVFPNPAHGQITLHCAQIIPAVLRVFNVEGKLVDVIYPTDNNINIVLPFSGLYIIETEANGKYFRQKVLNR